MKIVALMLVSTSALYADAGTLIPLNKTAPDPAILSMEELAVDIWIDGGNARVLERQIFASHSNAILEGNYTFALPGRAMVSDFAVWDGVTRIPGVILERKRAEQLYQDIKLQAIDPGLLQMGERDSDQARRSAIFSARIVPIAPYSSKRIEMEYHEPIPVEDLKSVFSFPLRPDAYRVQRVGHMWITLYLRSDHPVKDFQIAGKAYPVQVWERTPNYIKAGFEARNVDLSEDFTVSYTFDGAKGDRLEVATYRDNGPGYFQANALLTPPVSRPATARTVVALFDNSLSMQWEKLERNFQALETTLKSLRPPDSFNLALFNNEVAAYSPTPVEASIANIEKALEFVRNSRLRGGTNLQAALDFGLKQGGPDPHLVLFTDGGATQGLINTGKLSAWYNAKWNQLAAAQRPRTFVFAVGDDANSGLLKLLAHNGGLMEWVRSTEQIDFKLNAFVAKIGRKPVDGLNLTTSNPANIDFVYPLQDVVFRGSMASWIGQYKQPAAQATFTAGTLTVTVPLPAQKLDQPQLPRTWAKARVDALLEKIDRDGEDTATIDEIIRLSRKYKFVTPYTSFLAAPRALLRPRLIRPGDPVLRVKTDPSVVSVVALFPFGLVKKLRYLPDEDTWQTRFLAPPSMTDGTYQVRLILRDRNGAAYREAKSFVIASKPPVVKIKLEKTRYQHGDTVRVRATASSTTRTSVARMYGVTPVSLHWSDQAAANTGQFTIPAHLPSGKYTLTVTAEDFAHNIGSQEVQIEVAP
jgi:Ca-activated chloride channel family protein